MFITVSVFCWSGTITNKGKKPKHCCHWSICRFAQWNQQYFRTDNCNVIIIMHNMYRAWNGLVLRYCNHRVSFYNNVWVGTNEWWNEVLKILVETQEKIGKITMNRRKLNAWRIFSTMDNQYKICTEIIIISTLTNNIIHKRHSSIRWNACHSESRTDEKNVIERI